MAEASISEDHFMCSVCLDLLKDPVTVPCGHTYCMRCITECWNQEDQTRIYSCPQCRQTFSPRPVLGKNVMFAEMMEKLKKTKVKCAVSDQCSSGAGDVECDVCTGRKHKAIKSCLLCLNSYCQTHLVQHENLFRGQRHNLIDATAPLHDMICPQHDKILEDFCRTDQQCVCSLCRLYEHKNHEIVSSATERSEKQREVKEAQRKNQQRIQKRQKELEELRAVVESHKRCAQTAVEDCEMMFTELISSIERRRSEVTQLIRDQETAAVSSAEGLLERLKQEIDDLRRRDAELEKLLHTQHHIHLLQSLSSLSAPPGSTDSLSSITVSSLLSFDDVITSVSHLRDKLEHLCTRELEKISERGLVSSGQSLADRPLQTTSLTQSRPSAFFSGFDEKFKPPAGSWTCDTCLIQNMSSDKRCVSCISPRLNIDSDSDSKPAVATSSLLSLFAPPAGSWTCDTCSIINKPEAVKCVCCNMAKPGTQVNSSLISPSLTNASSAASSTTTTSTGTGLLIFEDTFKKPEGSWDCDLCLVHNNTQDVKCVACETPKPGLVSSGQSLSDRPLQTTSLTQSRPSASFSGFDEKFKPPAGSWTCDTCLIRNMSSDKRCVSCILPRLNIDSDSDSKPAVATSSLLSLFAPSAGSWSCDTCSIINKPEAVKCVCCNMAKPGTQVNSSLISPSLTNASSAASSTTTTSTGTGLLIFEDTFKKPEGSWDCDLCLVHNNTQDVKCVACETPKPGLVSSGQSLADRPLQTTSLTESRPSASISSSKPPAGSWTCDTCLIQNMSSDKRCVSCLSPRLNIDSDSDSKPAVATSSLLSLFAPSAGSWSCDTCSIINKPEAVKCVCCNMAKPGTQVNSSLISPSLTNASSAASSTTTTSTGTGLLIFGDTFKKPEGSWDCDLCLVHNNTQDVKCVACETPKPGLVSSAQSLADIPLQTTSLTESRPSASISSSKPPAGSWTCDTCLIRNMSSDKRCVSCLSPRLNIDSDSDSKPAVATSSLLSLFAPSAGSWSCDTCSIINKPEAVKCVCCVTAKPGTQVNSRLISPSLTNASSAASSTTTTSTGTGLLIFGDTFKKPQGSWDCNVCLVRNNAQDVKCIACETPKPGAEAVLVTSTPASIPGPLLGLSHKFKTSEGSWECEVCCVLNKAEDQNCVACQSKPKAKIQFRGDSSCSFMALKPEREDAPVSSKTILNTTTSSAANTIPVDPKFECRQDHLTGPPSPSFAFGKSVEAKVSSLSVFGQKPTPAHTFGSTAESSGQGIFEGGFEGTSEVWAGSAAPSAPAVSPVPVPCSFGQTSASNILSSQQNSSKDCIAARKILKVVRRRK